MDRSAPRQAWSGVGQARSQRLASPARGGVVKRSSMLATSWEHSAVNLMAQDNTKAPVQHVDGGQTSLPVGPPRFAHPARRAGLSRLLHRDRARSRRALTGATRGQLPRQRTRRQRFTARLGRGCAWSVGRRRSQRARHSLGVPSPLPACPPSSPVGCLSARSLPRPRGKRQRDGILSWAVQRGRSEVEGDRSEEV